MIHVSPGRRRLLGVGLTAYGLLGLAAASLVVVATLAVGPELEATFERIDQQRDTIVATLESSASALDRTAALVDDASGAVASSGEIASEAANVSRRLADTLSRLASTFGSFEILGNSPFAPLASDATQLAAQLRGIATDLDAIGIRLGSMARDIPALADDLETTSEQLAILADDLEQITVAESSTTVLRWLLVGIVLLVAWLVVPALIALGIGISLLRRPGPVAA
jgi:methyl-accepting chemotaxis protein